MENLRKPNIDNETQTKNSRQQSRKPSDSSQNITRRNNGNHNQRSSCVPHGPVVFLIKHAACLAGSANCHTIRRPNIYPPKVKS